MGFCALIRFMHMDNLYRQHFGKEVYIVTVGEFVTARVCLHVCDCVCLAHLSTIFCVCTDHAALLGPNGMGMQAMPTATT